MKNIIIVDRASSSGRTSLVKFFCRTGIGTSYLNLHIDEYIKDLPNDMWQRCSCSDAGWAEIGIAFNNYIAELPSNHDYIIVDTFYKMPDARNHLFAIVGRNFNPFQKTQRQFIQPTNSVDTYR